MKKSITSFIFLFLIVSLSFVTSQYGGPSYGIPDPERGSQTFIDIVQRLFAPLFGSFLGGYGYENLFEAILFFFILMCLIYVSLSRIELFRKKKAIIWVVTICASVLATRFTLNTTWVKFVLFPYSLVGVALLSLIPFFIFFTFMMSFESGLIRKFGWALFVSLYLGLWYANYTELGAISYIYLLAAIIGLIMIASDKYIMGWRVRQAMDRGLTGDIIEKIAENRKAQKKVLDSIDNTNDPGQIRRLHDRLDRLKENERYLSREYRDRS